MTVERLAIVTAPRRCSTLCCQFRWSLAINQNHPSNLHHTAELHQHLLRSNNNYSYPTGIAFKHFLYMHIHNFMWVYAQHATAGMSRTDLDRRFVTLSSYTEQNMTASAAVPPTIMINYWTLLWYLHILHLCWSEITTTTLHFYFAFFSAFCRTLSRHRRSKWRVLRD